MIRPSDPTEKHLYSAAWAFDEDSAADVQFSDLLPQHDQAVVVLIANKVSNLTGPMYGWASATEINTMFGL